MLPGAEEHDGAACLDLDVVASVLAEAVAVLEGATLPHLLIGGLASSLLGRPRCSTDVDLFVRPEHASAALDALEAKGFRTQRTNPNWLYKAFRREVLVDLLFQASGGIYVDDEMLRRSTLRRYRDVPVRVVPAEDLIVMKAIAHDEDTPRHHLRRGDYSRWLDEAIKDSELAGEVAQIEQQADLPAEESRSRVRAAIERRYTLPADG